MFFGINFAVFRIVINNWYRSNAPDLFFYIEFIKNFGYFSVCLLLLKVNPVLSGGGVTRDAWFKNEFGNDEKKSFAEPKLSFIEPKLIKQGDATKITAGHIATFYPGPGPLGP